MKTQYITLKRMLGGLAAASVFLTVTGTASAQSIVQADFGPDPQDLQSGWFSWDETTVSSTSRDFDLDFGNGSFGGGNNFRATFTDLSGGNISVGDRDGDGLAPLAELTQDFYRFDNVAGAGIDFEGLEDGSYTVRFYTNNFPYGSSRTNRLKTRDESETLATAPDEDDVINSLVFSFDVGIGADPFVASGETVQFLMDQTGGSGGVAQMNGFELEQTAIPEPGSFALIGGLLALGSVMLRRRHG